LYQPPDTIGIKEERKVMYSACDMRHAHWVIRYP